MGGGNFTNVSGKQLNGNWLSSLIQLCCCCRSRLVSIPSRRRPGPFFFIYFVEGEAAMYVSTRHFLDTFIYVLIGGCACLCCGIHPPTVFRLETIIKRRLMLSPALQLPQLSRVNICNCAPKIKFVYREGESPRKSGNVQELIVFI